MDTCICMAESLSYHCLSAIVQYKIKSCFCFVFFFLRMLVKTVLLAEGRARRKVQRCQ